MPLPQVTGEFDARGRRPVGALCGCRAVQCAVTTSLIVIILEIRQLLMKINGIPEERAIEVFAPDRPDQSFDEWMGHRDIRHGFDFLDLEDPQIREPPVKPKERIVVGANPPRRSLPVMAWLNRRHRDGPSTYSPAMPNPTMRRVNTSMTTRTQWLRRRIDSHRNRSALHSRVRRLASVI